MDNSSLSTQSVSEDSLEPQPASGSPWEEELSESHSRVIAGWGGHKKQGRHVARKGNDS